MYNLTMTVSHSVIKVTHLKANYFNLEKKSKNEIRTILSLVCGVSILHKLHSRHIWEKEIHWFQMTVFHCSHSASNGFDR